MRGDEGHKEGMSGSEGMGGSQRVWVDIKRGSNYLRRGSLGLQKESKGLKKRIARFCDVLKSSKGG